jgi:protocatechuate 3,4-dioxygenase beta subunit
VLTGADGSYRAQGLIPGRLGVTVLPVEEAIVRYHTLEVEGGRAVRHDLRVEAGLVAEGRVTERETGSPIAGAEVSCWGFLGKTVRTDESGAYRLAGVEADTIVTLVARAEGYGKSEREFRPGEGPHDLTLAPGRRATGRVLAPDGTPVERAYVAAVTDDDASEVWRFDWRSARTAQDGTFELRDLRADAPYALLVRKASFATLTRELGTAEPGDLALGDLFLARPASLEGRVVDASGAGREAWIDLLGPREPGTPLESATDVYFGWRSLETDDDGVFRCTDLAAGSYELRVATRAGARTAKFGVELREGEARTDLELALPAGPSVHGRILDPHGAPLAGAEVELVAEGPGGRPARARSGADGSFLVADLEPVPYTLRAWLWGPWPDGEPGAELAPFRRPGLVPGGEPLEIRLEPQRAVVAGVVRGADGRPVAQAFVFAATEHGPPDKGVLTDDLGRFELPVVDGRELELRARRTQHLSDWNGEYRRLDVLVGRKVPERGDADARLDGVRPGERDLVLRLPD